MATIELLTDYTDYASRKVRRFETTAEYEAAVSAYETRLGVNFNPNDWVSAELVVSSLDPSSLPNYMLVLGEDYGIESRWFVLRSERLVGGQYRLSLRRDVVADKYWEIASSPLYVEKGTLPDTDPMILNSEGLRLNQIKESETLLKDELGCPWLVGYIARSTGDETITSTAASPTISAISLSDIAAAIGISASDLSGLINVNGSGTPSHFFSTIRVRYGSYIDQYPSGALIRTYHANDLYLAADGFSQTNFSSVWISNFTDPYYIGGNNAQQGRSIASVISANASSFETDLKSKLNVSVYLTDQDLATLQSFVGKTILYNGAYYKFSVSVGSSETLDSGYFDPTGTSILKTAMDTTAQYMTLTGSGRVRVIGSARQCELTLTTSSLTLPTINTQITSSRLTLTDRPYDIFAIPLINGYRLAITNGDAVSVSSANSEIAFRAANQIAVKLDAQLYDLQLLPYCPLRDCIYPVRDEYDRIIDYWIKVDAYGAEHVAFEWITATNTGDRGVIMWLTESTFRFQLKYSLSLIDGMKIDSQISNYRLVSPNYQGSFDFNVAFNGGEVSQFLVECTYKPYTPFIKVSPDFSLLYGEDFGDQRGLICGGDFSVSIVNSAWQNYQLNNKNYQNIFNRDIQNLRFEQYFEKRNQLITGAASIFSDTMKGATAGFMASGGNPYATAAGAVIGGTTSAIGYAVDADTIAKRQREQLELATDKFGYSLANVQALPYTLTKVDQFDAVSKIFPFLEHYTCTEQEKEALMAKIEYEGMTVNRMGTLAEFAGDGTTYRYVKGYLVWAGDTSSPSNVNQAIADEISKGVYI